MKNIYAIYLDMIKYVSALTFLDAMVALKEMKDEGHNGFMLPDQELIVYPSIPQVSEAPYARTGITIKSLESLVNKPTCRMLTMNDYEYLLLQYKYWLASESAKEHPNKWLVGFFELKISQLRDNLVKQEQL